MSDLVAARCAHLIIRSGIGTKCAEGVLRAIAGNTLIPGKNAWLVIGRQHEERPACAVALSDEDMLRVVFSEHGNLCTVIPLDPVIGDVALAIQRVLQP